MKFQNPSLNFFKRTEGRTNERTHKPKPICSPLFQSWGHKKRTHSQPSSFTKSGHPATITELNIIGICIYKAKTLLNLT